MISQRSSSNVTISFIAIVTQIAYKNQFYFQGLSTITLIAFNNTNQLLIF